MKKCIECNELINENDVVCSYCQAKQYPNIHHNNRNNNKKVKKFVIGILILFAVSFAVNISKKSAMKFNTNNMNNNIEVTSISENYEFDENFSGDYDDYSVIIDEVKTLYSEEIPIKNSEQVIAENIEPEHNKNKIPQGEYKVGTEISAGEYILIQTDNFAYYKISKDSKGVYESTVFNDSFKNRSFVTVYDGQYLFLSNCEAYPIDFAPKLIKEDNTLGDGQYKVGFDFPEGEYKIISYPEDSYSSVKVTSDNTPDVSSVVSSNSFNSNKYITIFNGQYIEIDNAKIILNKY